MQSLRLKKVEKQKNIDRLGKQNRTIARLKKNVLIYRNLSLSTGRVPPNWIHTLEHGINSFETQEFDSASNLLWSVSVDDIKSQFQKVSKVRTKRVLLDIIRSMHHLSKYI